MTELQYTAIEEIPEILSTLRSTFKKGVTRPLAWRRQQLHALARMVQDHGEEFAKSIAADLGKPRLEAYIGEIGVIIDRCLRSAEKLEEWAAPERVNVAAWQASWAPTIYKTPRGVVLVIGPWNYPLLLTLQPFLGAIAAGCCAVVKPSEVSPNFSALLAKLLPQYLDTSAYRVINGAVPETTKLLELQWDHIFYTGNGRVGRIVAAAAAKHLTPVTLELGGKSPVIIDAGCDIKLAAKRILWGKICNAGQICIAPDYILIPRGKQAEFVAALKEHYSSFYPDGALTSPSYGHIITKQHHDRLKGLLDKTKGKVALGGKVDDKLGFETTVVQDVRGDDSLMEDEIFGPLLPLIPVDSIDEAIEFVNARSHPLVLYAFTDDAEVKKKIIERTISGGLVFNDTFQHVAVGELPFGGVGESGYGSQFMKATFDTFTHNRSSIDMPKEAESLLQVRYPPYTEENFQIMTAAARQKIPE